MFGFLIPYIEITIPVSLIIASVLLLRPLFDKRYAAKLRYFIWLIIAIRLIFPYDIAFYHRPAPPVQITFPDAVLYSRPVNNDTDTVILPEGDDKQAETLPPSADDKPVQVLPEAETPARLTVLEAVSLIWICGTLSVFLYLIGRYFIVSAKYRNSSAGDYTLQKATDSLCREMNIKNSLPVYRCSRVSSPVIMGIFRPRIYIPCIDTKPDILDMILRHELMHYRRKDILYKFILMLSCCIFWFNPFVWMMNRQAQKDIEISCDDAVIKGKDRGFKKLYSDSIMSMLKANTVYRPVFSTGFANDKQTIAARFRNIYSSRIKRSGRILLGAVTAVCVFCSGMIAFSSEVKAAEPFEIPGQAMDFMQFYCNYRNNDTYFERDGYDLGFAYLFDNNLLAEEYVHSYSADGKPDSYRLPIEAMMDVYQFIMADEMPEEWWDDVPELGAMSWAADYNYVNSPYTLTVKEAVQIDKRTFSAVLLRERAGVFADNISFTMEKQTAEYIPYDLKNVFTEGQDIWRIKDVKIIPDSRPQREDMVFEIDSLEDFLLFADDYNKNGYARAKFKYILTADIDFGGMEITPIGSGKNSSAFQAVFDGRGHTLSNFTIIYEPQPLFSGNQYVGLFAEIRGSRVNGSENGIVKNLNITGASVRPTSNTGDSNVGGTAILAGFSNKGRISNCHVSGTVDGHATVGGLVGCASESVIENCSVNADVSGHYYTGVFAGNANGSSIFNCLARGTTTGYREDNPDNNPNSFQSPGSIGGFAGDIVQTTVFNCHSDVSLKIMDSARIVGTFSASGQSAEFIGCTYNPVKTGNWEIVDYYHEGFDGRDRAFDIKPANGTGNYVDYSATAETETETE